MSRTLSLLGTSKPGSAADINIIVYGQSVSKQEWWLLLKEKIESKFPDARIHMVNKSVGGFSSQKLWKTTEYDILPFYPDLVIFHVFGSHTDYEKILRMIRSRTSAEMLVWNDPYTRADSWSDTMSYHLIPSFCEKYKLEFANIRDKWMTYLTSHGLTGDELTVDGTHLNERGNRLLANLLFDYFSFDPSREADPYHLVDTVTTQDSGPGPLSFRFTGNRADLFMEASVGDTVRAKVLFDNHSPSSIDDIYYNTRPNADSTLDWPWQTGAVIHTSNLNHRDCEKWTLEMTSMDDSISSFRFRIYGSLTGYDGNGISSEKFISNSGKLIIEPDDWFIKPAWDRFKVDFRPGYTITWEVRATFADYIDNIDQLNYTLIQGTENRSHFIRLIPFQDRSIPIKSIVIYKPFLLSE